MRLNDSMLVILLSAICSLVAGLISAIIVGLFNQYLQKKKEKRELKREMRKERLDKLYAPIREILSRQLCFGGEYIGLNNSEVSQIVDIIGKNIKFADEKLEQYYYSFHAELAHMDEQLIDQDGKFSSFIEAKYKKLRKKLQMR